MLLTGFRKEIFRPECNPHFESLHCIAHLNDDIACVLPYLNAVLGGTQYLQDPPEVMFHHHGKIIKVGAREIALNALRDESEAERLLSWMMKEINRAWEDRDSITPSNEGQKRPLLLEVLKRLPKTNCKKCGLATCMVFAAHVVAGGRGVEQCPDLTENDRSALEAYLNAFEFDQ